MKTSLLLFFSCLVFSTFGQFARSVYSDGSTAGRRSSLFSVNGETTILSIRESSNDTLRVMLIDIDEKGETDNYRMVEYSPLDMAGPFALSGIGTSSAGEVTMCIIKENTNGHGTVHYIRLDPLSGTFSDPVSINGTYRKGFARSRQKGDSLVGYLALSGSGAGMERVSRSLTSADISTEAVNTSTSYASTIGSNKVASELLLDGSVEYISTADRVIRRNSANSYIETSIQYTFYSTSMCRLPTGELFVLNLSNGDYSIFDSGLTLTNSGTIPELAGAPTSIGEMYLLGNNQIRVWQGHTNPSRIVDLTPTYTASNVIEVRGEPYDQFKLNGKQYVIGVEKYLASSLDDTGMPFPFNSDGSNITIVHDDGTGNIPDFIEYDQVLTSANIEFHTGHLGHSFNDYPNNSGFKFTQNNLQRSLMYASATSIVGTDISSSLKGTIVSGPQSLIPGPYCAPGNYNHEIMDKYNRGYYVTKDMIEMHLFEISAGTPYYEIPFGIREWPAHGDVSLGQAANLANFIDQNGNGTYEPELGDYPAIYGDQCLLNIYHQHPNSSESTSIETHQYFFTFDCDSSETIKNTVFVRTNNFSRAQDLYDVYEGSYTDFDIGSPFDDYIGTNVELGMVYGYNGDMNDEPSGGSMGYNDTIPAAGMISLQGLKLDNDGLDNFTPPSNTVEANGFGFDDGIIDNEYYSLESSFSYFNGIGPYDLISWRNVMMGLGTNGSPKSFNGVDIRHDYFGTSDPVFYTSFGGDHGNNLSEGSQGNPAGDRRMISASGPSTFLTSDTVVLLKAFVVGVDTVNLSVDNSVQRLFEHGQNLRDYFAQNATPCGNNFGSYVSSSVLGVEEEQKEQIIAYPNPASQQIQFRGIVGAGNVMILDLNGRVVISEPVITDDQPIDISSLEKSIYIIQISDENGTQTIRMVKQ